MSLHSENINELAQALSRVQALLQGAKKDSNNPFYKSKYADLESVWDACREALTNNGFAIAQPLSENDNQSKLITLLLHKSGQWIKSEIKIKPQKEDIQSLGAAITYLRRYSLCALVGVIQEDDDAESAIDPVARKKKPDEIKTQPVEARISSEQATTLDRLIAEFDKDIQKKINEFILNDLKADSVKNILQIHFPTIMRKIMVTQNIKQKAKQTEGKNEEATA